MRFMVETSWEKRVGKQLESICHGMCIIGYAGNQMGMFWVESCMNWKFFFFNIYIYIERDI